MNESIRRRQVNKQEAVPESMNSILMLDLNGSSVRWRRGSWAPFTPVRTDTGQSAGKGPELDGAWLHRMYLKIVSES